MNIVEILVGPVIEAFNGWRDRKHDVKMAKHKRKLTTIQAEADVMKARAEAEAQAFLKRETADINWELESIKNSGWKDEYLTIVTTAIIGAAFIPASQAYVKEGFNVLTNNTPMWFQVMAAIVWSSAFGVRVFKNFRSLVGGRNASA